MADLLEKQRAEGALATLPPTLTTPRLERDMADIFLRPTSCSGKGTQAELIASAWLMGLGYQVFRNVCPTGPADVVIWRPETGEIHFIDVKSANGESVYEREDGSIVFSGGGRSYAGTHRLVVISGKVAGFYDAHRKRWYWPLACDEIPSQFSTEARSYKDVKAKRLCSRAPARSSAPCLPSDQLKEAWK